MTIVFEKTDAIEVLIDGAQTSAPFQDTIIEVKQNLNFASGYNNALSNVKYSGSNRYLQIYGYKENDYIQISSVNFHLNFGNLLNLNIGDDRTVLITRGSTYDPDLGENVAYIETIDLPIGIKYGTDLNYSPLNINSYIYPEPPQPMAPGQTAATANFIQENNGVYSQIYNAVYANISPYYVLDFRAHFVEYENGHLNLYNAIDYNDFKNIYQDIKLSDTKFIDGLNYKNFGATSIDGLSAGPFYLFEWQKREYVNGQTGDFFSSYTLCEIPEIDELISLGYFPSLFYSGDNTVGIILYNFSAGSYSRTIYILDIENFTYQSITMIGGLNPDGGFIFDNWGDIQLFPTIFADKTGKINIYAGATYPYYYGSLVFPQITTSYRSRLPVKLECSNYCIPLLKKGAK